MTNTKTTKRALLFSILALVLCMSMFVGTTFAWFTDSVTSAGNKIVAGTLDVDLLDEDGNSMAGEIIEFVTADNRAQSDILWEPGCTYFTEPVFVKNNGSLALKYEIIINGIDGNAKLLEAIEWTVTVDGKEIALADLKGTLEAGDMSGAIVLKGHMKEEAGNEYQGLSAEGISITVVATQLSFEYDSFDNKYDEAADFAAQNMLKAVAAVAAGESATVKLESDGYVLLTDANPKGATVKGDVTLDLNGKTIFVKAEDAVNNPQELFEIVGGGKLTVIGNGTINMVSGKSQKVTAIFNNVGGTLNIKGGTYAMDVKTYAQGSLIPTIVDTNSNTSAATTIIDGGNFYHTRNMFRNFAQPKFVASLIINGGTFNGQPDDWAAIWNQNPASSAEGQGIIEINGGKFNYIEIDNDFNTGLTIADGVAMPKAAANLTDVNAILASGDNVVLEDDVFVSSAETGDNGYGKIGVSILNGSEFDGNGNTVGVNAWATWDSAINTTGGTIKNVVINSGMRGIFINHNSTYSDKVILENVIIDGTVYTISCDQGTNKGLEATNSVFNGWTSYAATIGDVKFTDCSFGEGQGYAYCRPYAPTTFVGCDFEAGYELEPLAAVTFENCTIGGVALTDANLATLVISNIANATVIG